MLVCILRKKAFILSIVSSGVGGAFLVAGGAIVDLRLEIFGVDCLSSVVAVSTMLRMNIHATVGWSIANSDRRKYRANTYVVCVAMLSKKWPKK